MTTLANAKLICNAPMGKIKYLAQYLLFPRYAESIHKREFLQKYCFCKPHSYKALTFHAALKKLKWTEEYFLWFIIAH
jgi:hypothetical protein